MIFFSHAWLNGLANIVFFRTSFLSWASLMSPTAPTSQLSRLSLERMGPTARQGGKPNRSAVPRSVTKHHGSDSDDESSNGSGADEDNGDDGDDDEEDTRTIVSSPATRLAYDISGLDSETQSEIRQLFREGPASEPPSLVLQWCQFNQEQDDSQFYAFQLHEIVPRSIRIGSPTSKYNSPRCNCMADNDKPCRHLIYLLDQLNYFSSDRLLNEPVQKLGTDASPGPKQLFERISSFHLNMLASNLHCDVGSPESNTQTNSVRLAETREILATLAKSDGDEYAVQHFRPDIFEDRTANSLLGDSGILSYGDLTATVANMLVTHNDFFAYFLKLLGPMSRARDPFRKIQQHVERVLRELDGYFRDLSAGAASPSVASAEGPCNVPWAAAHLTRAVSIIQHLLQNRQDAPSAAERASAARTLVRILHTVVFDWNRNLPLPATATPSSPAQNNNLYQTLIGSRTTSPTAFVLDTLAQLPEQNQWIETLERIEAQLVTYGGISASYLRRLRDLIALMRSSRPRPPGYGSRGGEGSSAGVGSKRNNVGGGGGREGGAKRMR